MYVIVIYDVFAKRTNKIHKLLKKYLLWVQNSVFEGEVSESELKVILFSLKKLVKEDDSIIIYRLFSSRYKERIIIGEERNSIKNII